MQTIGLVTKKEDEYIEVTVIREESCGSNCENCSARCAQTSSIKQKYKNTVDANVGDKISIETENSYFLRYMTLVYGLPLLVFVLSIIIFNRLFSGHSNSSQLIVFAVSIFFTILTYFGIKKFDNKLFGIEETNVTLRRL